MSSTFDIDSNHFGSMILCAVFFIRSNRLSASAYLLRSALYSLVDSCFVATVNIRTEQIDCTLRTHTKIYKEAVAADRLLFSVRVFDRRRRRSRSHDNVLHPFLSAREGEREKDREKSWISSLSHACNSRGIGIFLIKKTRALWHYVYIDSVFIGNRLMGMSES